MPHFDWTYTSQEMERLDKVISQKLNLSRSLIQKHIKDGHISVNGLLKTSSYLVKKHDTISAGIAVPRSREPQPDESVIFKVLYEDSNVVVIDKPAGLVVHPGVGNMTGTLVQGLLAKYPEIKNVGTNKIRCGIAHRLDKDTSGVMIAAKTNHAFDFLKTQFLQKRVQKTYTVLVYGIIRDQEGTLDHYLVRSRNDPKKFTVKPAQLATDQKSKRAITVYTVDKRFDDFTLVQAKPQTGRTHQIRVQFAAIGHPVVGDVLYRFKNLYLKKKMPVLNRHFLHSSELEIEIPDKGDMKFTSPLAKELKQFLGHFIPD